MQIKMTPSMGRGVFASRAIAAGEVIDRFQTIRVPAAEVRAAAGSTLANYWFEDDTDGSALFVLGYLELVNHSLEPNADRRWAVTPEGDVAIFYALRDIETGEQLFIDYRFAGDAADPDWSREGERGKANPHKTERP